MRLYPDLGRQLHCPTTRQRSLSFDQGGRGGGEVEGLILTSEGFGGWMQLGSRGGLVRCGDGGGRPVNVSAIRIRASARIKSAQFARGEGCSAKRERQRKRGREEERKRERTRKRKRKRERKIERERKTSEQRSADLHLDEDTARRGQGQGQALPGPFFQTTANVRVSLAPRPSPSLASLLAKAACFRAPREGGVVKSSMPCQIIALPCLLPERTKLSTTRATGNSLHHFTSSEFRKRCLPGQREAVESNRHSSRLFSSILVHSRPSLLCTWSVVYSSVSR